MSRPLFVSPAQAGAQRLPFTKSAFHMASKRHWVPAFAGTTSGEAAL